ncbi:unnamed protein product [Darwinula stevensoni]|uniref:EF-hand domain-containing protein n=1 Tax=Darwinula stevensoni TaxID=69355 RepID=A0A7R9FQU1_9CRUS|nr:unnamed protein product [Darwinula stevensoni]CAG0900161.1 unnamed protein product [Darwinula stevensoni]
MWMSGDRSQIRSQVDVSPWGGFGTGWTFLQQRLDLNEDGVITWEEFLDSCLTDDTTLESLGSVYDVI